MSDPGADVRRPAWQVASLFLALRAAHAFFAPFSPSGLTLVQGFGVLLLVSWWAVARAPALVARTFAPADAQEHGRAWFAIGGVVVALGLCIVEWRDGPFFLEDDNFDQFLPVMRWAWRSLREGVLPLWNPHQFMGAPAADVGVYALTYPPTYVSVALAELLGQPRWALDIFALLHLGASYPATYWAARRMDVGAPLAAAAGLSFTLSGYHLMGGRSWYYMLPLAMWLPVMVGSLGDFCAGRVNARWAWIAGGAAGVLFHAGNAQMWTYANMAFVSCALTALALGAPRRGGLWLAVALAIELALAAPLLVPELALTHGLQRKLFGGGDIAAGLASIVVPFGLAHAPHPMAQIWGQTARIEGTYLYACGALLPAVALFTCLLWLVARPRQGRTVVVCTLGTLLALALALGRHGGLWPLLAYLPAFSMFQVPYKLIAVFNLFACLTGAAVLQRWGARSSWVFTFCVVSSLFTCFAPLPGNSYWPRRDYGTPDLHGAQRFLPLAPRRTSEPEPAHWLTQNVPSFHGFDSVDGYDTFTEAMPETRLATQRLSKDERALQAYGIDRVLLRTSTLAPMADAWQGTWEPIARRLPKLAVVQRTSDQVLLAVPDPRPLVFDPATPAPIRYHTNGEGVTITLAAGAPRALVINYLHRRAFQARDGGNRELPLRSDEWGRMVVSVPAGVDRVSVRYSPPFWQGLLLAAICLALAQALASADSRARRRSMK